MSEETKQITDSQTELAELNSGVIEAGKTEHGFRMKGKWWAFCIYGFMAMLGVAFLLWVGKFTGIFDVIKAFAK